MLKSMRRFVASVLCVGAMAASAEQANEKIRLAPPQAMFRDSITLNQFVSGTLRFVLLHEIGHGFVDLYGIPVLGREEDAADRFATWWMAPDGEGQDGTDAIAAMEWWLASARTSGLSREQLAWWDEHGIDEQRGYQIACLLYGSDPQTMGPLAGRLGLPAARRDSCTHEAQENAASWSAFLRGQASTLTHNLDGFIVPKNYVEAESPDTVDAAKLVRDMKLLEELAGMLGKFKFPEGAVMVRLYAQDCGMANAYWDPNEKNIVLCHELVNHVANVGYAAGFR